MEYFIGYIVGVVTYAIISTIMELIRSAWGTLTVDRSNPEKDVYKLNIDDLDSLNVKKRVILRVVRNNKTSQN